MESERPKRKTLKVVLWVVGIWFALGIIIEMTGLVEPDANDGQTGSASTSTVKLQHETIEGGFFTMLKPKGWDVFTAGQCSEWAILLRDRSNPLRQVFYFGTVGPLYMSQQQRMIDQQAVAVGGYPTSWMDSPAIEPFTPENFFANWPYIAAMQSSRAFMPQCPQLANFQVVSSMPVQGGLPFAQTGLVRGLFTQGNQVGQGQFMVSVWAHAPFTGAYGAGTGVGSLVCGITAGRNEFASLQPSLVRCLGSLQLSQQYASQCVAQTQGQTSAILRAGRTLSEASDMIMNGWQRRNQSDDIIAAKRSDAMLGKERVYNPNNNEVYEFDAGWYDRYKLNPQQYDMNNLQLMSNQSHGFDVWNRPVLDGPANVR